MTTYVLDTNVMLSDPKALERMGDLNIVIPLIVLNELEAKRTHPELGYSARSALRYLETLRKSYGDLINPIRTSDDGTIRVEINHIENSDLPDSLKTQDNDAKILAVATNLAKEINEVILITKDLPLRLKAAIAGIRAEDYETEQFHEDDWCGIHKIKTEDEAIDYLNVKETIYIEEADEYPINSCLILQGETQSALARIDAYGNIEKIKDKFPLGLRPKNTEQQCALSILTDPRIGIASVGGLAGSGKTVMALASGLQAVTDRQYKKVIVFRPIYSVGGQELGFLPGTQEEKMAPWAAAVNDALESFLKGNEIENYYRNKQLEILPLTHIRGRTLSNSYVIIDEAQNLDLMVLVTALSRMGNKSKVVLTHDVNQRDNLRVGKYDGISKVISKLSDNSLFGHISLVKSERSEIAELVSRSFDL